MHTISQNKPLLFIQGPPVFIRVDVIDDESTSVFVPNMEEAENPDVVSEYQEAETEVPEEVEEELPLQQDSQEVKPSVARRIAYLTGAFQKEVYRPLEFHTSEETFKGVIGKVEGDKLYVELEGAEKNTVPVEMREIEEIYWRGEPFAEI